MLKKTFIISSILLAVLSLTACGNTEDAPIPKGNNVANAAQLKEKPTDTVKKELFSKDFGENFKESVNNFVAYVNQENQLMLFNKETGKEVKVADQVKEYQWYQTQLFYQTTDKVINEYVSLDQLHKIDTAGDISVSEIVHPFLEQPSDNYFASIYDFDISQEGKVVVVEKHGVLESEYWFKYKITDTTFKDMKEILSELEQYSQVINELKWNNEKLVLVIGQEVTFPIAIYENGEVKEIHSNIGDFIDFNAYYIKTADLLEDGKLTVKVFNEETQESSDYEIDLKTNTSIKK